MARDLSCMILVGLAAALLPNSLLRAEDPREITIEGRIQCVGANRNAVPCAGDIQDFALLTDAGARYFFTRKDPRSKIFQDARVRERRLRVLGWPGENNLVEITKVYSVKGGQLYDIFYYCPICSITAYAGGPCWCCQEEFEFHETPVRK